MPLGGDDALIATSSGRFFRYRGADNSLPAVGLATSTPNLGGFLAPDGEVWLFGTGGSVAHGKIDALPLQAGPPQIATRALQEIWADGAPSGPGLDVFIVGDEPSFQAFDGHTWTRLDAGTSSTAVAIGVAWVGPGEAYAVLREVNNATTLLHAKDGKLLPKEAAPTVMGDYVTVIARAPGLGVVLGTKKGYVFRLVGGRWVQLNLMATDYTTLILGTLGGRPILSSTGGALEGLDAMGNPCSLMYRSPDRPIALVQLEQGVLVVSHSGRGTDTSSHLDHLLPTKTSTGCML
jgi:hypothetical protein